MLSQFLFVTTRAWTHIPMCSLACQRRASPKIGLQKKSTVVFATWHTVLASALAHAAEQYFNTPSLFGSDLLADFEGLGACLKVVRQIPLRQRLIPSKGTRRQLGSVLSDVTIITGLAAPFMLWIAGV